MVLRRGANAPVPSGVSRVRIVFDSAAGPDIDACALLLTESGKVRDDSDFVFYNQPASTDGSVRHLGRAGRADALEVDLARLPAQSATVALVASADGASFGSISGLALRVTGGTGGEDVFRVDITTATSERAFVFGELYRRAGAWKFRAVGQGWSSGLAGLATAYGITVDDPPAAAPSRTAAAPPRPVNTAKAVRLRKQLSRQPPAMVNLVKQAGVSLDKHGLGEHRARVALCLDISSSMTRLYRSGKVQELCERILGLAVQLDDDGRCDVFTFGTGGYDEGPLDLRNYHGWVDGLTRRRRLESGTDYAKAMEAVREHYFPDGRGRRRTSPRPDTQPVYVMFVTDGHTSDRKATRDQVAWSSYEPLFWQFMAIGRSRNPTSSTSADPPTATPPPAGAMAPPDQGRGGARRGGLLARLAAAFQMDFSFLTELDEMGGRFLDNASFFAVADPGELSDSQLYDLMMTEYPDWLRQAATRGLISGG